MWEKFVKRGYPKTLVHKYIDEAINKDRNDLLRTVRHKANKSERIPFVSTFGSLSGSIYNVLQKHWAVLRQGCPKIEALKQPPLMSHKRDRNLRDALAWSDIGPQKAVSIQKTLAPIKMGNFPCLNCSCCSNLVKGDAFSHPYTGKNFKIKQRSTCTSSYVVSVILWPCGLLYVGKQYRRWSAELRNIKAPSEREWWICRFPPIFWRKDTLSTTYQGYWFSTKIETRGR